MERGTRVLHDVCSPRSCCSWANSPEELLSLPPNDPVSLKNTFTPSVCQTIPENNSSGPVFSTSWVESAKTERICHPNRRTHAVRNESSNKAVVTEKCQVFRPAADSSAQLATVEARPTQSKVQSNNGGHCGSPLIRGVFQFEPSASEFELCQQRYGVGMNSECVDLLHTGVKPQF